MKIVLFLLIFPRGLTVCFALGPSWAQAGPGRAWWPVGLAGLVGPALLRHGGWRDYPARCPEWAQYGHHLSATLTKQRNSMGSPAAAALFCPDPGDLSPRQQPACPGLIKASRRKWVPSAVLFPRKSKRGRPASFFPYPPREQGLWIARGPARAARDVCGQQGHVCIRPTMKGVSGI